MDAAALPPSVSDAPYDAAAAAAALGPLLTPEIDMALMDYQREAVWRMHNTRRCINAASPGLGKTIMTIATLCTWPGPALVICPAYLTANWVAEFRKWDPERPVRAVGAAALRKGADPAATLVMSYGTAANAAAALAGREWAAAVCDESHFLKGRGTKRFKRIKALLHAPRALARPLLLLSGSPAPNRNAELFAQFHLVHPRVADDYYDFAYRYCDARMGRFGFEDSGASNVEELTRLARFMMLRMHRDDYLTDLPRVARRRVALSAPVPRDYRERARALPALVRRDPRKAKALVSELFRRTADIKRDAVVDFVRGYVAARPGEKVVVFCAHHVVLDALAAAFPGAAVISGRVPVRARPAVLRRFLGEPDCTLALLTMGSCATGLNVTPVKHMIFAELDWSPSTLEQCECRIRRIGGAPALEYTYLLCEGTLDASVFRKVEAKADVLSRVIDGGAHGAFD